MTPNDFADRIERAMAGPMWHGPALAELLGRVSSGQAVQRPVAGAHSVWELVLHVTVWADVVRGRLASDALVEPRSDEEDWPPVPAAADAAAWRAATARLAEAHRALAAAVRALPAARLDDAVPGKAYAVREMLLGVVEHATYHGGQIALLARALGA
jgi:uncharacterized damage-inducible protein DinB